MNFTGTVNSECELKKGKNTSQLLLHLSKSSVAL